jgi:uncharacterized damage-inducible protein DinB
MPGNVTPVTGERDGLLAYLAQQRYALRISAFGLTDEQARATPSASALSVGGLIKHLTASERSWLDLVLQRHRDVPLEDAVAGYLDDFRLGEDETLAGVLKRYEEGAAKTDEAIAGIADLGQPVPIPKGTPWYPDDDGVYSVRWVLLHLIEETARHAGHADIVRESIDGATAFPLMAAAEGWPPSPWIQPWEPPGQP